MGKIESFKKNDKKVIILKNDRIGDLVSSIPAINLIIKQNKGKKVLIYLSNINYKMNFLLDESNVEIIKVRYNLKIIERIKIIFFIMFSKIESIYILRPKNFYYLLPLIFYIKKIKFYGYCLNNNSYKRPKEFLRRFLTKYVINDRGTKKYRISGQNLQIKLVNETYQKKLLENEYNFETSELLKKVLPNNYLLIHYKKIIFDKLEWGTEGLDKIIFNILKFFPNVVLINDIEPTKETNFFKKKYKWFDMKEGKFNEVNSKVLFLPNLEGIDLINTIKNSTKIIAVHGTITLLSRLIKKPTLDLFHCEINTNEDYYRYKNAFHEWKPKHSNYKFTIPNKKIDKTIKKINLFCQK